MKAQTETNPKAEKRTEYKIEKSKACSLEFNSTTLGDSTLTLHTYDAVVNHKGNTQVFKVSGSELSAEVRNYLCKAQNGDKFYLDNIKLKKEDGSFVIKPPITYIME